MLLQHDSKIIVISSIIVPQNGLAGVETHQELCHPNRCALFFRARSKGALLLSLT